MPPPVEPVHGTPRLWFFLLQETEEKNPRHVQIIKTSFATNEGEEAGEVEEEEMKVKEPKECLETPRPGNFPKNENRAREFEVEFVSCCSSMGFTLV